MSENVDFFATNTGGHRDRPFLYPWNRNLRHLQGVSLRNANTSQDANRSRGKTITDDDAPYNLKSPTKRLARNEAKALQHSKSFSNLSEPVKGGKRPSSIDDGNNELLANRPVLGKMRRRSTLHWTGASPRARQKKLEDVAANRMVDTWFSIHHVSTHEPVYVSEVMEKSMNPSFRFFDLSHSRPEVVRSDDFTVKVWAKAEKNEDYHLLLDLELSMRSMQFIGGTLENFHHPLPPNCVLFHLPDGIYTSFTDMAVEVESKLSAKDSYKATPAEPTSSYDTLMQLSNLDDCIQDALRTRKDMETQLNALLKHSQNQSVLRNESPWIRAECCATEGAMVAEGKHVRQMTRRKDELRRSVQLRREAMSSGSHTNTANHEFLDTFPKQSQDVQSNINQVNENSAGQIRRICEDLMQIYPIEPLKYKTLQFSIRGIHLPNSVFDDTNRDEIGAAIGMASKVVYLLSLYLSAPLPYPVDHSAGLPLITDPISIALSQRKFPLQPTNVAYKFEYGVFLLNKNIEFLMSKSGLRILDIRHTLPNLKYLMYVLTAGTGELPARKAGGIRGLAGGWGTPSVSRRGSNESISSNKGHFAKLTARVDGKNSSIIMPGSGREKGESNIEDPFGVSPHSRETLHRGSLLKDSG